MNCRKFPTMKADVKWIDHRLFRTKSIGVEISVDKAKQEFLRFNSYSFQIKSAIP
jgi:hypothetical protein